MTEPVTPKILSPNPYINDPYIMSGVILNKEAWLMLDQLSELPSNREYPYDKKRKLENDDEENDDEENDEEEAIQTELFEKYKEIDEKQQRLRKAILEEEELLKKDIIHSREERILKLKIVNKND